MFAFFTQTNIGKFFYPFFISMLPVSELRGGIPAALYCGFSPVLAYTICIIGNMLPVPFIILFSRKIFAFFKKLKPFAKIAAKIEKIATQKADKIIKYEILGLFLFVAIPLPMTGAWTAAFAAALMDLRLKNALPAIFWGVLCAGAVVLAASLGIIGAYNAFLA